jgi:hypothetical protein
MGKIEWDKVCVLYESFLEQWSDQNSLVTDTETKEIGLSIHK